MTDIPDYAGTDPVEAVLAYLISEGRPRTTRGTGPRDNVLVVRDDLKHLDAQVHAAFPDKHIVVQRLNECYSIVTVYT